MRFGVIVALLVMACGRLGFRSPGDGDGDAGSGDADAEGGTPRVLAITAGRSFACAVRDGEVWCWGDNRRGQLGTGDSVGQPRPQMIGISDATTVAAGDEHACAIRTGGAVWCWGNNSSHQVGTTSASSTENEAPVPVGGLGAATAITAGSEHTCAIVDGVAWCWGDNDHGQLGILGEETPVPQRVLGDVAAIDAGEDHTCALRNDGSVSCWGDNAHGQIGDDPATIKMRVDPMQVPDLSAKAIFVGGDFGCAVTDGRFRCWGEGDSGQLGTEEHEDRSMPTAESTFDRITTMGLGTNHTCAIRDGDVVCWGEGDAGQLGAGPRNSSVDGVNSLSDGRAVAVAAGNDFSCAIRDNASVACWGLGSNGQLGNGIVSEWTPQKVALAGATAVATGAFHSCAIAGPMREVWCWGDDHDRQLGDGRTAPQAAPIYAGLRGATQLALGDNHSCARLDGDEVWCWGEDDKGQLGNTPFDDGRPYQIALNNVTAIASGDEFSCAVSQSGVFCWGTDSMGQLGDGGAMAMAATPQLIPGLAPLVPTQVAAGKTHACVASQSGVKCWGAGDDGQLGSRVPGISMAVTVTGSDGAWMPVTLAAGGDHTCAIDAMGRLLCWGNNSRGELGISPGAHRDTPVAVSGLVATEVTAGDSSTCARTTLGTFCWGDNSVGQLGDGTTADQWMPAMVRLPAAATSLAAGTSHACALVGSDIYCWGDNSLGQVGNGKFSASSTPVEAAFP